MPMRHRRFFWTAVFAAVMVASLAYIWSLRRTSLPSHVHPTTAAAVANPYSGPRAQVEDLRKGEFRSLTDRSAFEQALDRNIKLARLEASTRAHEARLQAICSDDDSFQEIKQALARKLLAYLEAFASSDPDAYLAIADAEPTRWITPDSTRWNAIDDAMRHWYGRTADHDDPRAALRLLLPKLRTSLDYALTRGRIDDEGIDILLWYARVPSDLNRSLIWDEDPNRFYFWMFGASNTIRFRDPVVTPADIIRRDRGLLFAEAFFVLSPEADKPHVWHSVWYYDPHTRTWLNHLSEARSWYSMPMFY